MIELFVGDVDAFDGSDAVDNQFRFHIVSSALLLTAAQSYPIDVYGARIDALCGQGANYALQTHIHLMLDEGFGYGEVVELDDGGENFLAQEVFMPLIAGGFEALMELGLEFVERAGIADVFGEFVVQFG